MTWRRLSKVSTALFAIIDVDLHTITNNLLCPNETERLCRGCNPGYPELEVY